MRWYSSTRARLGLALLASSLVSVGLWAAGAISNHSAALGYLIWNLALAWIPLFLAVWLELVLRDRLWSSWLGLLATVIWLGFLPNSFYVLSDFVHLTEIPRIDIVFDTIIFGSFAVNGLFLGYLSLYLVHGELRKRLSAKTSTLLVGAVLLLSSFAIYVGRDLRWNTWDVILSPASLLFDVSDRIINAGAHPQVVSTTLGFFLLLSSTYAVVFFGAKALRQQKTP
ncbi:MAG TPA: DUF1361 domain-containing protein [Candidatus Pristimantibacillus sp.]|nr:DUF1361 domain-containing protein [Candidatus Pristimantibacillus sp.]